MTTQETVVLFRPVGQKELDLIRDSGWKRFPPRFPAQPFFYPVLTEDYAVSIARDWNTKDPNSGYMGYVLRFRVLRDYIDRYETHDAGAANFANIGSLRRNWMNSMTTLSEQLKSFTSSDPKPKSNHDRSTP
jgi:hypothetical protein